MWWLIMIICNPICELQFEQVHGRLSLIVDQIRCQTEHETVLLKTMIILHFMQFMHFKILHEYANTL